MLAPNDIEPIVNSLKNFYANTLMADKLSTIGKTLTIYPIENEAEWITSLRRNAANLYENGEEWQVDKLVIVPHALEPFISYNNTFTPISNYLINVEDGETAANILDRLIEETEKNIKLSRRAQTTYNNWIKSALSNIDPLNDCIKEGWRDLGASETKIVTLAEKIIQTQNNINRLNGVIALDSISSGTVSNLSSVLTSTASMIYSVAVMGYAVPYLSVGMTFFTLGKMFYDIYSSAEQIHKEIRDLTNYRLDLTYEQQALAQTKSSLVFIYEIKELIAKQRNSLSEVEAFWESENRNLHTVRNNFALDKNYSKQNPEISQLSIANSIWFSLKDTTQNIMTNFNRPIDNRVQIEIG